MKQIQTLSALFSFPGFRARSRLRGIFGDPHARLVVLVRRKTAVCSGCGTRHRTFYDRQTRRVRDTDAVGWRIYLSFEQRRVACSPCQGVKVERLNWLARNPRYTQRLAQQVGILCRDMSNKAVAQLLHLHEHTVRDLDTQYMRAWLAKTPQPGPQVICVDERSIKKRLLASDCGDSSREIHRARIQLRDWSETLRRGLGFL